MVKVVTCAKIARARTYISSSRKTRTIKSLKVLMHIYITVYFIGISIYVNYVARKKVHADDTLPMRLTELPRLKVLVQNKSQPFKLNTSAIAI